jgi:hypothetical protein
LAIIVVATGFFKAAAMLFIALRAHSLPLMTIGDAIASFLAHPDYTTKGMCLWGRRQYSKLVQSRDLLDGQASDSTLSPLPFNSKRRRRLRAASPVRITIFLIV